MIRSGRIFFGAFILILLAAAIPLSKTAWIRSQAYSGLKTPLGASRDLAQGLRDLAYFQKNADELRLLKATLADQRLADYQTKELLLENERLTRLLNIKKVLPDEEGSARYARVIGRSPSAWNRVFLIDKGTREGIGVDQPVLSGQCLVGKVIEAGPAVSKVLLMTDPGSRIGVLIQRTRQQGVLYGTVSGECRIKYLSVNTPVRAGDVVESAGFGGFFPKGLLVGRVTRAWKEPGQIYQVAQIVPATDLSRIEEVTCLV